MKKDNLQFEIERSKTIKRRMSILKVPFPEELLKL